MEKYKAKKGHRDGLGSHLLQLCALCTASNLGSENKSNWSPSGISSVQFSSVAQSCLTLCDPVNRSTPGLPVHYQLPEFTQIHVHWVSDAIQSSHPLVSPSPSVFNLSHNQYLFKWVSPSHQVAKVLELQHLSFQYTYKLTKGFSDFKMFLCFQLKSREFCIALLRHS